MILKGLRMHADREGPVDIWRATVDRAGRLVTPKPLRDAVGLTPGEVEITIAGSAIRIEPVMGEGTQEALGRRVIEGEIAVSDDDVRRLRQVDQR